MSKALIVLAAIIAVGAAGGAAWHFTQNTVEKRFASACIETIKERLRSPSSFKLLEVKHFKTITPTMDEYMGWESVGEREEFLAKARRSPDLMSAHEAKVALFDTGKIRMLQAFIEYEAANGFGASVRGLDICTHDFFEGSDPVAYLSGFGPRVNGDTALEWSLKGLSQ